jgi:hypothetical protein
MEKYDIFVKNFFFILPECLRIIAPVSRIRIHGVRHLMGLPDPDLLQSVKTEEIRPLKKREGSGSGFSAYGRPLMNRDITDPEHWL